MFKDNIYIFRFRGGIHLSLEIFYEYRNYTFPPFAPPPLPRPRDQKSLFSPSPLKIISFKIYICLNHYNVIL